MRSSTGRDLRVYTMAGLRLGDGLCLLCSSATSPGTTMRRIAVFLALVLVSGGVASLNSPALADSAFFADGISRGSMDIRRVRVVNERRLTVRVVVKDLRRRAGAGSVSVWLDKTRADQGLSFTSVAASGRATGRSAAPPVGGSPGGHCPARSISGCCSGAT